MPPPPPPVSAPNQEAGEPLPGQSQHGEDHPRAEDDPQQLEVGQRQLPLPLHPGVPLVLPLGDLLRRRKKIKSVSFLAFPPPLPPPNQYFLTCLVEFVSVQHPPDDSRRLELVEDLVDLLAPGKLPAVVEPREAVQQEFGALVEVTEGRKGRCSW